jgi:hypothetical protein
MRSRVHQAIVFTQARNALTAIGIFLELNPAGGLGIGLRDP